MRVPGAISTRSNSTPGIPSGRSFRIKASPRRCISNDLAEKNLQASLASPISSSKDTWRVAATFKRTCMVGLAVPDSRFDQVGLGMPEILASCS